MRSFFRRLFCLHSNWERASRKRGGLPWLDYWQCQSCGKVKGWEPPDEPINYIPR
jgi:hypothetical protein